MMLTISQAEVDRVRLNHEYVVYQETLTKISASRFRGLGVGHSKRFVRHAVGIGDELVLPTREDVAYLMLLMNYLGTFFLEDPRYDALRKSLSGQPKLSDRRMEASRRLFLRLSDRFIGEDMSIYCDALETFIDASEQQDIPAWPEQDVQELLFRCYRFSPREIDAYPVDLMRRHASSASQALGHTGSRGHNVCLCLGFWMGTGFYRDPLFPWITDILGNPDESDEAKLREVIDFAMKRAYQQIKLIRQENV